MRSARSLALVVVLPVLPLALSVAMSGCKQSPAADSARADKDVADDEEDAPKGKGKAKADKRAVNADDEESDEGMARVDPDEAYRPFPRQPELQLSDDALRAVLAAARAGCDGKAVPSGGPADKAPVLVVVYAEDGTRSGSAREDADQGVIQNAHAAGKRACKSGDDRKGFVHALVVTQQANLINFGIKGLFDNKVFEPQVTGIAYRYAGRRFELDPLQQLERNMGPMDTRTAMAKGIGLDAQQIPNRIDLSVEMYRTAHIGESYPKKTPQRFFRGHAVLDAKDVDTALLGERLKLIGEWYRNNVIDGEVTYAYLPSRKVYQNEERTMIRSTITTLVLNRLALHLKDAELQDKGKTVLDFYLKRYFGMEAGKGQTLVASKQPIASGNLVENRWTVAGFLAAAALERTDRATYQAEMDQLMKWGASYQRKDGVLWSPSGAEQYFMPGQFLLPVTLFYRATKDPFYKDVFDKAFAVYEPNLYQTMDFGPEWHTPYAPAWFTQPLAQMYLETGDDRYKDLIFAINDRVALAYDINARYQVYPDYDGILAPKPNSTGNNSVTAASLEALTDAAIVAKRAGDTARYDRYRAIIKKTTAYLMRLQYVPENTYYLRERKRVVGAFKNDLVNTRVWMDSVWHLTSAWLKIHENKLLDP